MSIRRYLFLLLSAVIVLLSISQLFLAWFFKGQLEQEVQADSRALSRELVSVVFDSTVEFGPPPAPELEWIAREENRALVLELEKLGEQYGELSEVFTIVQGAGGDQYSINLDSADASTKALAEQKVAIAKAQKEIEEALLQARSSQVDTLMEKERELEELQQLWAEEVQRATAERYREKADEVLARLEEVNMSKGRVEFIASPGVVHQVDLTSRHTDDLLSRYVEWMLVLISVTGVGAILLASWVITWVSRPLTELADGHKQLGDGNLGVQIREQGVRELKRMLAGFNSMSRKLAELSQKEQLMAGQQHLAELGQITRGIAHSLRNPLQTLGMLSDSVEQCETQQDKVRLMEKMRKKIEMMDKQIQSLLTLSANGLSRNDALPVQAIVQDILLELSVTGRKVSSELELEAGLTLTGAESELRSILHAVIVNACEASPEDNTRIKVEGKRTTTGLELRVTDWGKGLTAEQKQHLGEPHFTTKAEGTGMGLYIALRLLEAHYGGEIEFADNPEGGAVAFIKFREESL